MSPEQARAKPLDRRTDIWAFGCVLFEMLTGKQAFAAGETVSDAVAAILKSERIGARCLTPRRLPSEDCCGVASRKILANDSTTSRMRVSRFAMRTSARPDHERTHRAGKEIFYRTTNDTLVAVTVRSGDSAIEVGDATTLFQARFSNTPLLRRGRGWAALSHQQAHRRNHRHADHARRQLAGGLEEIVSFSTWRRDLPSHRGCRHCSDDCEICASAGAAADVDGDGSVTTDELFRCVLPRARSLRIRSRRRCGCGTCPSRFRSCGSASACS